MRSYLIIAFVCVLALFISCHSSNQRDNRVLDSTINKKDLSNNKPPQPETPNNKLENINLEYGFILKVGKGENFGDFKTYSYLEVWHNDIKLFTDTTNEYEFDQKPYPILNQIKSGRFELLIKYNDSPNYDKLTFLKIENNKIIRKEILPAFDNNPEKINGILEYSAMWDSSEEWDENGKRYITYDPILFYKFTSDGVKLDTALTILKNKSKYGRFEGFNYNENIGYPIDENQKIDTIQSHVLRKQRN